ncbi:MAG: FAD/NAD(P)-binding protein [Bdellovibrionota bacterium]|nr:MAG: FAD/NAD(P)-binding protein [Bdellovibrionota bacterium]
MQSSSTAPSKDENGNLIPHRLGGQVVIAIVGAGFSGAMVAANLMRRVSHGACIALIDGWKVNGQGAAYGRCEPSMILNVRANAMGAWPDDPGGFMTWCAIHAPQVQGNEFAARELYGRYIEQVLAESEANSSLPLQRIHSEIVSMKGEQGRFVLRGRGDECIVADAVVLATGNMPPPSCAEGVDKAGSYIDDPWREGAAKGIENLGSLFVIGTGLTAIDFIVHANARGFRGAITCLSRHGLFPRPHLAEDVPVGTIDLAAWDGTLRHLMGIVRKAAAASPQWQTVIDALRPHTVQVWQRLSLADRQRFLRHLKTLWDVHRHRIPVHVHELIQRLIAQGRLQIVKGRVGAIVESAEGTLEIEVIKRGSSLKERFVAQRVVNCTGPQSGVTTHPLLKQTISEGILRADRLGLGIETDTHGKARTTAGPVWVIGPLRRPDRWESSAVRELRVQASEIADDIVRHFAESTLAADLPPQSLSSVGGLPQRGNG